MRKSKVVCTFPGKLGDLLWSLTTMNAIADRHKCKIDVATSEYCRPAITFIEHQDFVNEVFVPKDYVIHNYGMGIQPWEMPVKGYPYVYQLGFKYFPPNKLEASIATMAGVLPSKFETRFPDPEFKGNYIVVANTNRWKDTIIPVGNSIAKNNKDYRVIWIADNNEEISTEGINRCGLDFWDSAGYIMGAKAVITTRSANAVLTHLLDENKPLITLVQGYEDHPIFEIDGEQALAGGRPVNALIEEVNKIIEGIKRDGQSEQPL